MPGMLVFVFPSLFWELENVVYYMYTCGYGNYER